MAVEAIDGTSEQSVESIDDGAMPSMEEMDKRAALGSTSASTAFSNNSDGVEAYKKAVATGDLVTQQRLWSNQVTEARVNNILLTNPELVSDEERMLNTLRLSENASSGNPDDLNIEDIENRASQMTEEQKRNEAHLSTVRHAGSEYMTEFSDETILDNVGDLAGIAFLGKKVNFTLADYAMNAGYISTEAERLAIMADDVSFLNKHNNMFNSLGREDQARLVVQGNVFIDEQTDNKLVKGRVNQLLYGLNFDEGERRFENVLDDFVVFDALTVGGFVAKASIRSANIINAAIREKNLVAEMLIIDKVIESGADMAKMGVKMADAVDASDITLPQKIKKIFTGEKLSLAAEVAQMKARQSAMINAVLKTTNTRKVLTQEEEAEEIARITTLFDKRDNIKSGSVSIVNKEDGSYDISYTVVKMDKNGEVVTGARAKEQKTVSNVAFTTEGVKPIMSAEKEYIQSWFRQDPNAHTTGRMQQLWVTINESVAPERARLTNAIDQAFRLSRKGLSKKDQAVVDTVLKRGDELSKEWTLEELTNPHIGVGIENITMTDKQAKAYLGYRNVSDELFKLEDEMFRNNLSQRGMSVADLPNQAVAGKAYDNAVDAWDSFKARPGALPQSPHILVMGKAFKKEAPNGIYEFGSFDDLSDFSTVQNWYNKGYRLMRVDNEASLFVKGETHTQWALVRESSVLDPRHIPRIMNRKTGYVAKSRTNANWFVKVKAGSTLSGVKGATAIKTLAWSDNKADAIAHIANLQKNGDKRKMDVVFDRALPQGERMYDSVHTRGGLYSGARKTEELEYVGADGGEGYISSMEAMQGYVNHVGRQFPISMIRLSQTQRALETAEAITKHKGFNQLSDLKTLQESLRLTTKQREILDLMHDQVAILNNMPTSAERATIDKFVERALMMEGSKFNNLPGFQHVPRFMYNQAAKGVQPVDYIRSVTFMHMLGLWNPAQYLIQGSATVVPMSVNPLMWTKAIPKTIGANSLDLLAHSPEKLEGALKWFRANGMDEFVDGYELWHRSGIREDILNSNANYVNGFSNSLPFDAGVLRQTLGNHTVFYEAGELAQSRQAFFTAVEWFKGQKANKGMTTTKILTDPAAQESIRKRMEIYRLNMSRMNQSNLNKGAKSIPLQFKQVISKYFEKVLPKNFGGTKELTTAEKWRLGAVPTAMFGTAGVPLLEPVATEMMNWAGHSPIDMDPDLARLYKYGAVGALLHGGFQMENDVTSRLAMGTDIITDTYKIFMQGQPVWKSLGPSGNVLKRYQNNISWTFSAFDLYTDVEQTTTFAQDLEVAAQILVNAAADIPTLSRNVKDYGGFLFTDNPYFMKNGENIVEFETFSAETKFFAIMGFQPTLIKERYESKAELRKLQGGTTGASQFLRSEAQLLARTLSIGILDSDDEATQRGAALLWQAVIKSRPRTEWIPLLEKTTALMNDPKLKGYDTWRKIQMELATQINEGVNIFNADLAEIGKKQRGQ